jgi:hypothetical protein
MTSELRTKKGVSSLPRIFSASLRGPAVPRGSDSMLNSMRTLYFSSYYEMSVGIDEIGGLDCTFLSTETMTSGR